MRMTRADYISVTLAAIAGIVAGAIVAALIWSPEPGDGGIGPVPTEPPGDPLTPAEGASWASIVDAEFTAEAVTAGTPYLPPRPGGRHAEPRTWASPTQPPRNETQ